MTLCIHMVQAVFSDSIECLIKVRPHLSPVTSINRYKKAEDAIAFIEPSVFTFVLGYSSNLSIPTEQPNKLTDYS